MVGRWIATPRRVGDECDRTLSVAAGQRSSGRGLGRSASGCAVSACLVGARTGSEGNDSGTRSASGHVGISPCAHVYRASWRSAVVLVGRPPHRACAAVVADYRSASEAHRPGMRLCGWRTPRAALSCPYRLQSGGVASPSDHGVTTVSARIGAVGAMAGPDDVVRF